MVALEDFYQGPVGNQLGFNAFGVAQLGFGDQALLNKQAGDGVGLGLAISSGIVNDLGGRLYARNGRAGGAVFEVQLPLLNKEIRAAE